MIFELTAVVNARPDLVAMNILNSCPLQERFLALLGTTREDLSSRIRYPRRNVDSFGSEVLNVSS
jgi:hypothetical protein